MNRDILTGPFTQLLSLANLPPKGSLRDEMLEIIPQAGILSNEGVIVAVGDFDELHRKHKDTTVEELTDDYVAMPGFIDTHTHICWAGSRAQDYTQRLAGKSYMQIAESGGGIWETVTKTRLAGLDELTVLTVKRAGRHLSDGVTTIEVKSGYGLTVKDELKILQAIHEANMQTKADLVPTCLAAHICPKDFTGTPGEYLEMIRDELLPAMIMEKLSNRVDIFIEKSAFSETDASRFLEPVIDMGLDITVHGDQFSTGGSSIAKKYKALSVDHLEASGDKELKMIAGSEVVAVALPGSSLGLGQPFTPARKLLDAGASLAIASDWNPGSAPMGDLLVQAALLGVFEKLTVAETFAAITCRAARALNAGDRGTLTSGKLADFIAFPFSDFREILYNQGRIKPVLCWKKGERVANQLNTDQYV